MKSVQVLAAAHQLGASAEFGPITIGEERQVRLTFGVRITNGSGVAPTSAPLGTWSLLFALDNKDGPYFPLENTDVLAEFARLAAVGNTLVQKAAIIHDPPGAFIKLAYTRGTGGGAGTSCDAWLEIAK